MQKAEEQKLRFNFEITKHILEAWYPPDEFQLVIIYAPLGYGKSSFQFKVTVEVLQRIYHLQEKEAWECLKSLIVFHPEQFFEKLDQIHEFGFYKLAVLNWDDAGLWLFAMDWNDPFIIAFTKWLNVARTDCSALLCSTPSPKMIIKKLRDFPKAITVKIYKEATDRHNRWKRKAKSYTFRVLPDLQRTRVRTLCEDYFSCKLPNDFYRWYLPKRDAYAKMAQRLMRERWRQLAKASKALKLQDYPTLDLPTLKKLKTLYQRAQF